MPILEKAIIKKKTSRLVEIGFIAKDGQIVPATINETAVAIEETIITDETNITTVEETEPSPLEEVSATTVEQDEETAIEEVEDDETTPFGKIKGNNRSFSEKLEFAGEITQRRYQQINEKLTAIKGVREIKAKRSRTYKKGNVAVAKLVVKGKTLNVYLGLNPSDYADSKYVFSDESSVKAYANYPMRVKLSSDRQVRWANELIDEIAKKNNFN